MCLDPGEAFVLLAVMVVIYGLPIVIVSLFFFLLIRRSSKLLKITDRDS
jgi:hypothetical protein